MSLTASDPNDPRYPGFPPEVPFPLQPDRPSPWSPPVHPPVPVVPMPGIGPGADPFGSRLYDELLAQRRIFVRGTLDADAATLVAAQLMALDDDSEKPVTLLVNSPGGPLDAVGAVLDTIEVVQVPVDTTCLGLAGGTAVVVVAAGTGVRRAGPSARLQLRLGGAELSGSASQLADGVAHLRRVHDLLVDRLATITGQDRRLVAGDVDRGRTLAADEAVTYGLLDELTEPRSTDRGRS